MERLAEASSAARSRRSRDPYAESALYLARRSTRQLLQSVPTFREVMDFRTSARLVVPSACESGLGAQNRGEGIQGLTRAGCLPGRVVASQWRVDDDATAEVMAASYLALLGHASGLPTQFRIGLVQVRGNQVTS
jgi:CHAT domain-containing protein